MTLVQKTSSILLITLLGLSVIFALPQVVWAVASDVELFDGYTDEASLQGLSGSTGEVGWGEVWQDGDNTADLTIETTGGQSNEFAIADSLGNDVTANNDRNLASGISDGSASYYTKRANTDANANMIYFRKADTTLMFAVHFERSGLGGDVLFLQGDANEDIGNWDTAGSWELVEVEWGDDGGTGTCAANQVRARFNGGTWGACHGYKNSTTGDVENIQLEAQDAGGQESEMAIDELTINDDGAAPATAPRQSIPIWTRLDI